MDLEQLMRILTGGMGGGGFGMPGGAGLGVQGAPMDMSTGAVNPGIGVEGAGMPPPEPAPPLPPSLTGGPPAQPDYGTGPGQITRPTVPGTATPRGNYIDTLTDYIRKGTDALRGGGGMPAATPPAPTSLGEALQPQPLPEQLVPRPEPGVPVPQPRPPMPAPQPAQGYYGGSPETNPNLKPITGAGGQQQRSPQDISKLLGGIKQPQGPDVVKPSTPAAHQTRAIGPSDLMALLASIGMGGHRSQRMPTTLGQALELKPSSWGGIYG
jgi:hypothetical protein